MILLYIINHIRHIAASTLFGKGLTVKKGGTLNIGRSPYGPNSRLHMGT